MQHKKAKLFEEIEAFLNDYADENGTSPTVREIAAGIGVSNATVCKYLAVMEENGLIRYDEHRKVLTRQMMNDLSDLTRTSLHGSRMASVVGVIKCGGPDDAEQYVEETVRLPRSIFGDGPLFLLHASGDSMIEDGIEDGDLVVVRQQSTAEEGDIVVALTPDGTTLKGYFPEPEKRRVRLQPANRSMKPMYYADVTVQGVAVKVIKDVARMGRGVR
ncbi:MAG: repressor LexA [Clostridia bacterium]|nr:repressor LexA [Clostridia bacterium]